MKKSDREEKRHQRSNNEKTEGCGKSGTRIDEETIEHSLQKDMKC